MNIFRIDEILANTEDDADHEAAIESVQIDHNDHTLLPVFRSTIDGPLIGQSFQKSPNTLLQQSSNPLEQQSSKNPTFKKNISLNNELTVNFNAARNKIRKTENKNIAEDQIIKSDY